MHTTVLKNETLEAMALKPGEIVFEGTAGEGGLTRPIAGHLGLSGMLIVTDLDADLLEKTRVNLSDVSCRLALMNENFRNIKKILVDLAIVALDVVIVDLGLCSAQIETSGRGFSFERDEPLLMTFKNNPSESDLTAYAIVNTWSEENLADIIYGFGGERAARKIAKVIVGNRPIAGSGQLANIIEGVTSKRGRLHPATKTFQAIRMVVNDEVGALKQLLADGWPLLRSGGRLVAISFHEVEDRIVKQFFMLRVRDGSARVLSRKPIGPSQNELKDNPRARSAKLRALIKI